MENLSLNIWTCGNFGSFRVLRRRLRWVSNSLDVRMMVEDWIFVEFSKFFSGFLFIFYFNEPYFLMKLTNILLFSSIL
ncbi:unnamed protein product [Rhizophagus irregularis]|uniref:Uncharacterized protein n=1 Tax=Rhizophagus irregularis TaxID=588596 RepID=A0A915ZLU3_9GLOM|nr:unnamed protein product [Rhizophagus irregularis]CAB5382548.1 unnamed protein product [Rhizophagus irregularis]